MITISTRKRGQVWEYRFDTASVQGQRKQNSRGGFRTKKEAEQAGMAALREYEAGGLSLQPLSISFADFLDYWMNNYCRVNLKDTTCEGYAKKIKNHIKPALGKYSLHSINTLLLQEFINSHFNAGYSRNSLSVVKGILSGAFSYAVSSAGFLSLNPMATVRLPNKRAQPDTRTRKKIRNVITASQWNSLMQRFPLGHSCHLPLMLGYHLGLRLGEAFALAWSDIDFDRQTITISRQIQWAQEAGCWCFSDPKYDSFRTLTVDPSLIRLLKAEYERQQKGKGYYADRYQQMCVNEEMQLGTEGSPVWLVNTREDGSYIQPRVTQHLCYVAHTQLNMPHFDFHTLRHTHATMLLEAGVNPIDIQERLSHAKLTMTWRYAHNTATIRNQTTDILASLFA